MGAGGESREISIVRSPSWSVRIGANRGSCKAALAAQRTMASPSGSSGSTTPMQPCRRPRRCSVTKTPQRTAKISSCGIWPGSLRPKTLSTTAVRASCSAESLSVSERDGILGLLARLKHPEPPTLLDAVVHVAPEAKEILCGGDQRADYHQPEQHACQPVQRGVARADN